jgi:hypothetical protein
VPVVATDVDSTTTRTCTCTNRRPAGCWVHWQQRVRQLLWCGKCGPVSSTCLQTDDVDQRGGSRPHHRAHCYWACNSGAVSALQGCSRWLWVSVDPDVNASEIASGIRPKCTYAKIPTKKKGRRTASTGASWGGQRFDNALGTLLTRRRVVRELARW